jgi:hypothetical protein
MNVRCALYTLVSAAATGLWPAVLFCLWVGNSAVLPLVSGGCKSTSSAKRQVKGSAVKSRT